MPGLTVGCTLSALSSVPIQIDGPDPVAMLTVLQPLIAAPLYAGQSLDDLANYASITGAGNFTSTGGAIVQTVVAAGGNATAVDAPLAEGDVAGFSVNVTDSIGTEQTFASTFTTVQFKSRLITTVGNEVEVQLNPLVPDEETIEVVISGGTVYDGTYTPTAGDLRQASPYNFPNTTQITYSGPQAELAVGATLTVLEGLFTTLTGTLNFTYQWRRGGVPISGATGRTYVLVAADLGATITCVVIASDGINPAATVTSSAVNIPAGVTALSVQRIFNPPLEQSNLQVFTFPSANLSAVPAGTPLYLSVTARDNATDFSVLSITVDGAPASPVANSISDASGTRILVGFWQIPRPANGTVPISVTFSESIANSVKLTVFAVPGATGEFDTANGQTGGTTPMMLDLDTRQGAVVLAAFVDEAGGILTWAGVGNANTLQDTSLRNHATAFASVAVGQTPYPLSITTTSATQKAGSAVCIV